MILFKIVAKKPHVKVNIVCQLCGRTEKWCCLTKSMLLIKASKWTGTQVTVPTESPRNVPTRQRGIRGQKYVARKGRLSLLVLKTTSGGYTSESQRTL